MVGFHICHCNEFGWLGIHQYYYHYNDDGDDDFHCGCSLLLRYCCDDRMLIALNCVHMRLIVISFRALLSLNAV